MDWNSYYRDQTAAEPPPAVEAFHAELVSFIRRLLPEGGASLEAGCGAGWQSRALAETGMFRTTLIDSSEAALAAARFWFDRAGVEGEFLCADIREFKDRSFDLVFNVGVLEHYSAEERIRIVGAMAKLSRKFVLVLEPNPTNYWYWIWRHRHTARGTWPFGRETPSLTLPKTFEAAGLRCDGVHYFGAEWTTHLLSTVFDRQDPLLQSIREIHSAGILPAAQHAYLVGAVGVVGSEAKDTTAATFEAQNAFTQAALAEGLVTSLGALASYQEQINRAERSSGQAATIDEVKNAIRHELDSRLGRVEELVTAVLGDGGDAANYDSLVADLLRQFDRLDALRQTMQTSGPQASTSSGRPGLPHYKSTTTSERRTTRDIRSPNRAFAAASEMLRVASDLIGELQVEREDLRAEKERWHTEALHLHQELQRMENLRSRTAYGVNEYDRAFDESVEQLSAQRAWKLMLATRQFYVDLVRRGPAGWGAALKGMALAPLRGIEPSPEAAVRFPKLGDYLPSDLADPVEGSYRVFESTSSPAVHGMRRAAPAQDVFGPQSALDVVVLSIVDFEFRFQRPQQIAVELARRGGRVFWVSPSSTLPPTSADPYRTKELADRCWDIVLRSPTFDVYFGELTDDHVEAMTQDLVALCRDAGMSEFVVYVQLPFWAPLARRLRSALNAPILYDCMDDWDVFPNVGDQVKRQEPDLVRESDLVIVTADRLREKFEGLSDRPACVVRNACDFEFYQREPTATALTGFDGPIVGFFGALASWIDVALLEDLARRRPELTFVLVGQVFDLDVTRLEKISNVVLEGAQPYERMPAYLRRFDVCIIPFLVNDLTDAVDPVKVYEYLTLGKPVVATRTEELVRLDGLIYLAGNVDEFVEKLDAALEETGGSLQERRVAFAKANSWRSRVDQIGVALHDASELVSILIVTYNSAQYLAGCLRSIIENTFWPRYEIIVVDNASTDETAEIAHGFERPSGPSIRVVASQKNLGFAGGTNRAAQLASGDLFVLLNADTAVSAGWIGRLRRVLASDPALGLVSAVTNFAGNEIKIDWDYADAAAMQAFARNLAVARFGETMDVEMAPLLACMCSRALWDKLGGLDDEYQRGMFEDDDFCFQVRKSGKRIVTAEDCFVHHFGQASFSQLTASEYEQIFEKNRERFERKWDVQWRPHRVRGGVRPVLQEKRLAPREFFAETSRNPGKAGS